MNKCIDTVICIFSIFFFLRIRYKTTGWRWHFLLIYGYWFNGYGLLLYQLIRFFDSRWLFSYFHLFTNYLFNWLLQNNAIYWSFVKEICKEKGFLFECLCFRCSLFRIPKGLTEASGLSWVYKKILVVEPSLVGSPWFPWGEFTHRVHMCVGKWFEKRGNRIIVKNCRMKIKKVV